MSYTCSSLYTVAFVQRKPFYKLISEGFVSLLPSCHVGYVLEPLSNFRVCTENPEYLSHLTMNDLKGLLFKVGPVPRTDWKEDYNPQQMNSLQQPLPGMLIS